METSLEREALEVIRSLTANGYEAYRVGGYVRDRMLGRAVKDIDIATSAQPETVLRLFARCVPTGLKHGTVTVLTARHSYEVTTFRRESGYEDFRRPAQVEFVSDLHEDLERRDFTINAMAMDADDHVIDPFDGRGDLERRIVRCVGDPEERFGEDALRMLRCVRFAAVFGFEPEPATWRALLAKRALLRHVAMERVRDELSRIVAGPDPYRGVCLLAASGLLRETKARLALPLAAWAAADDVPPHLRGLARLAGEPLRWAALLRAGGTEPEAAREALDRLKFSRDDAAAVVAPIAAGAWLRARLDPAAGGAAAPSGDAERAWKRGALRFGRAALEGWLAISRLEREISPPPDVRPASAAPGVAPPGRVPHAVAPPDFPAAHELLRHGLRWLDEMPVLGAADLAVGGAELIGRLGMTPGPAVGRLLGELLKAAALGEVPNEADALLAWAKRNRERIERA